MTLEELVEHIRTFASVHCCSVVEVQQIEGLIAYMGALGIEPYESHNIEPDIVAESAISPPSG